MKELTIDKNTDIKNIVDKDRYEKMIIKTKINPNKLNEFVNIKELTIDYFDKNFVNYNEYNIDKLSFKDNIEKIVFKNVYNLGQKKKYKGYILYNLELPNLKSIELPAGLEEFNSEYLKKCTNLEEIIITNDDICLYCADCAPTIYSEKLNKIILKNNNSLYEIKPDYKIFKIFDLKYDSNISLKYASSSYKTIVNIDSVNNNITKENIYHLVSSNNEIFIPDFITELEDTPSGIVRKISLNTKLLNHITKKIGLINKWFNNNLEIIELRNKNEMALMPTKIINIKDYGKLENVYIKDNLLYIDYDTCLITIDENSKLTKTDKLNNKIANEILNNYNLEELETYVSYLRLLKQSYDTEYQNAMNIIGKTLIKKYKTK